MLRVQWNITMEHYNRTLLARHCIVGEIAHFVHDYVEWGSTKLHLMNIVKMTGYGLNVYRSVYKLIYLKITDFEK